MGSRVISAVLSLKDKDFSSGMKNAANNAGDFERRLKKTANKVTSFRDNTVSSFRTMATGVAAGIAGAFAIDKIKDFGIGMIESAATMQATKAQFTQVFGDMQSSAQNTVDNLGQSFGMVSERLKPAFTTMTSMFKGLGMNTTDAMKQAESAVTLAADAAAFYDKSYEDANSALNSFIKGNYEGGEAIGLFASETQLATWAAKNLNLDWKNLDEAGKQVARLEFAKSMQDAAGATGQAARESNSYENQLGNLRSTWDTLKAKLGAPILEPAINGLKSLAEWVGNINTEAIINGFSSVGGYLKDTFSPVVSEVKEVASGLWSAFNENGGIEVVKSALSGLSSGLQWLIDNRETIVAATLGIAGGLAAFKIITGINTAISIFNGLMIAYRTGTLLSQAATWGLNTALLASPMTWVAVAIGAVIAAGVLLYQNFDTVKQKAGELWSKTKEVFSGLYDWGSSKIQPVVGFFKSLGDKFKSFKDAITNFKMPEWVSTVGDTLGKAAKAVIPGYAVGTNRVERDQIANIHKDEMIIPARQSEKLRQNGINIDNIDKLAESKSNSGVKTTTTSTGGSTVIIQNLNAKGVTVAEVIDEFVPLLQLRLANM